VIFRFDTYEHLRACRIGYPSGAAKKAEPFREAPPSYRLKAAWNTGFRLPVVPASPPRWKMALVTVVVFAGQHAGFVVANSSNRRTTSGLASTLVSGRHSRSAHVGNHALLVRILKRCCTPFDTEVLMNAPESDSV